MSDDEHTNGQMETNENSDSNENSVSVFFSRLVSSFKCVGAKRAREKFSIHLCSVRCGVCVCGEHSLVFGSMHCCCCFLFVSRQLCAMYTQRVSRLSLSLLRVC